MSVEQDAFILNKWRLLRKAEQELPALFGGQFVTYLCSVLLRF